MDGAEKIGLAIIVMVFLVACMVLGVGVWGFVEIVRWITGK